MGKDLKEFSENYDLDYFFNAKNIPNQDLVFATFEYFETGERKGLFEPLDFLNLLEKQYRKIFSNHEKPHSTFLELQNLPLPTLEKHVLFGFILKWFGGYPTNQLDSTVEKLNSVLRLIEKEFLSYDGETPEKKFCEVNWVEYKRIKQVEKIVAERLFNVHTGLEQPESNTKNSSLSNFTNGQLVLIFYFFFKTNGLEIRTDIDAAPVAKFIHLVLGKELNEVASSDIYKKLLKAPNFTSDTQLIKDLGVVKQLFNNVQLFEVVKEIDIEIEIAKREKNT